MSSTSSTMPVEVPMRACAASVVGIGQPGMGGCCADAIDEAAAGRGLDAGLVAVDTLLWLALALHGDDAAPAHLAGGILPVDQFDAHVLRGERAEARQGRQ